MTIITPPGAPSDDATTPDMESGLFQAMCMEAELYSASSINLINP